MYDIIFLDYIFLASDRYYELQNRRKRWGKKKQALEREKKTLHK